MLLHSHKITRILPCLAEPRGDLDYHRDPAVRVMMKVSQPGGLARGLKSMSRG
jgi:hypothetical protein